MSYVRRLMSEVKCKKVYKHLTSDIIHLTSDTIHLTSDIIHLTSDIIHLTSDTIHLTSDIIHLTSDTIHLTSDTIHLTSDIIHLTSNIIHLTSNIKNGTPYSFCQRPSPSSASGVFHLQSALRAQYRYTNRAESCSSIWEKESLYCACQKYSPKSSTV